MPFVLLDVFLTGFDATHRELFPVRNSLHITHENSVLFVNIDVPLIIQVVLRGMFVALQPLLLVEVFLVFELVFAWRSIDRKLI